MASINPYLAFSGNCEEAFTFYKSVFGGDFTNLSRFSDEPSEEAPTGSEADQIMHVSLPIGERQVLMGSDRPSAMGPTTFGDNVSVSVSPDSTEEARRIFEGLAAGGEVTMPFERTFWGADFGMCTDKYGINWMVNYDPEQPG